MVGENQGLWFKVKGEVAHFERISLGLVQKKDLNNVGF